MKTSSIILALMIFANMIFGQTPIAKTEFKDFAGTWKGISGQQNFIIILKLKSVPTENGKVEVIEGRYMLSSDVDTPKAQDETGEINLKHARFSFDRERYPNTILFLIKDKIAKINVNALLEINPKNRDEITWTVERTETITIGKKKEEKAISLPLKVTLHKVK